MHTHHQLEDWWSCGCGFRLKKQGKVMQNVKEIISLSQYLMGREVQYKDEYNQLVMDNAKELLIKVNNLLNDLGVTSAPVSSGWRPPSLNATIKNAAKRSLHMSGKAVDILDDKDQTLAKLILSKPELLKKYDLWIEDETKTVGKNTNWVHLDIGVRQDRLVRKFTI
jgi:hypothetical protein